MELIATTKDKKSTIKISSHSLDYLLDLYRLSDGDIELYLVLNMIDHYTGNQQRHDSEGAYFLKSLPLSVKRLNTTTLSKISGIPRETVRRKINKLIELGFVQLTGKKYEYKLIRQPSEENMVAH